MLFRQVGAAHEVDVQIASGFPAFGNGPYDQGLAAAGVTGGKHSRT